MQIINVLKKAGFAVLEISNFDYYDRSDNFAFIDRSFYNFRFANIRKTNRKKTAESSRFAHEIFTNAFPTKKRQPSCKYTTSNRTFCKE